MKIDILPIKIKFEKDEEKIGLDIFHEKFNL